jgi:hypothetical protein
MFNLWKKTKPGNPVPGPDKKRAFLLAGLTILPMIAILRAVCRALLPSGDIFNYILTLVTFVIILWVILDYKVDSTMNRLFVTMLNTRPVQRFILFLLMIEQITLSTLSIFFFVIFSFTYLYFCINFSGSSLEHPLLQTFFCFLMQVALISISIYVKLRKRFFNVQAFSDAGMKIPDRPFVWDDFLLGMSAVVQMEQKEQNGSARTTLNMGATRIQNRLPGVTGTLVLPVFPLMQSGKRKMWSAAREVGKSVTESVKKDPTMAMSALTLFTTVAGAGGWALSEVVKLNQQKLQHDELMADSRANRELKQKKLELEQKKFELEQEKFERELDFKKAKSAQNFSSSEGLPDYRVDDVFRRLQRDFGLAPGVDTRQPPAGSGVLAGQNIETRALRPLAAAPAGPVLQPDSDATNRSGTLIPSNPSPATATPIGYGPPFIPCVMEYSSCFDWFSLLFL